MEYQNILERDDLVDGDVGEMGDCSVVELLVEQAEAANIVVLNKTDLASKEQVEATRAVVKAINKKATVLETSYSKVALDTVLGEVGHAKHEHGGHEHGGHEAPQPQNMVMTVVTAMPVIATILNAQMKVMVMDTATATQKIAATPTAATQAMATATATRKTVMTPIALTLAMATATATVARQLQRRSRLGSANAPQQLCVQERFGIASFTYSARRPFSEKRFTEALKKWPVPKHSDLQLMLGDADPDTDHPMATVIRSKGFCWLEQEPSTRIYWSHAGKDMKLSYSGVWWGAMTEQQVKIMERLSPGEYERSQREDGGLSCAHRASRWRQPKAHLVVQPPTHKSSQNPGCHSRFRGQEWDDECGDRRQELVFIGQRLQEEAIRALLDECLLTDKEMKAYKKRQEGAQGEWGEEMYQAAASPV
eukprot:g25560.t1